MLSSSALKEVPPPMTPMMLFQQMSLATSTPTKTKSKPSSKTTADRTTAEEILFLSPAQLFNLAPMYGLVIARHLELALSLSSSSSSSYATLHSLSSTDVHQARWGIKSTQKLVVLEKEKVEGEVVVSSPSTKSSSSDELPLAENNKLNQNEETQPESMSLKIFLANLIDKWVHELQQRSPHNLIAAVNTNKQAVALIGFSLTKKIQMTSSFHNLASSLIAGLLLWDHQLWSLKDEGETKKEQEDFRDCLRQCQVLLSWVKPVKSHRKPREEVSSSTSPAPPTFEAPIFSSPRRQQLRKKMSPPFVSSSSREEGTTNFCFTIRIAQVFSKLEFPTEVTHSLKDVFVFSPTYNSSNTLEISKEVIRACNLLRSVRDKSDLATSSRWFREIGDKATRATLHTLGLKEFVQRNGFQLNLESTLPTSPSYISPVDSVVLANYIKEKTRKVEAGVITEPIQKLLQWLLYTEPIIVKKDAKGEGKVEDEEDDDKLWIEETRIEAAATLLSISPDRFNIMKAIQDVCLVIFANSTKDPITPTSLASIVPVADEIFFDRMAREVSSTEAYKRQLQAWHKILGVILSNEIFFQ